MWKTKLVIWLLAAIFTCGCGGTSCETQMPSQATPASPLATTQPLPVAPADLLTFEEIYTAGAKQGDDVPLIIAVHGLGDKPAHFVSPFEDLPFKARVVLPRAPDP